MKGKLTASGLAVLGGVGMIVSAFEDKSVFTNQTLGLAAQTGYFFVGLFAMFGIPYLAFRIGREHKE